MSLASLTLSEALVPRRTLWREVALVLSGTALIAVAAQIAIPLPFSPVPITGQTLAVLMTGALLGSRRGALSVLAYLTEGAIGFPVFAGSGAGLARLLGPRGGYLVGFVAAAWIVGRLCEVGWDRKLHTAALAMLVGNVVIYLFGLPWLAHFVGIEKVLVAGLLPFVPGDLFKLILAASALPSGWQILEQIGE